MNVILLNSRQAKMLKTILQAKDTIPLQDVVERCRIRNCAKTVRSDFGKIQDFAAGFQVALTLKRGIISISAQEKDLRHLAQATVDLYNSESIAYTDDRVSNIVLDCLLKRPIPSLDVWSERFNISRPCIQRDMKSVRKWLAEAGVELLSSPGRGYRLSGGEFRLRKAVVLWILEQYGSEVISLAMLEGRDSYQSSVWYRLFGDVDVGQLFRVLAEFGSQSDLDDGSVQYAMFALYVAVMLQRILSGNPVGIDELPTQSSIMLSVSVLRLSSTLERKLGVSVSPEELAALQTYYQELSCAEPPCPGEKNMQHEAEQTLIEELSSAVELMLGLPLSSDAKSREEFADLILRILRDQKFGSSLSNTEISNFAETYPAEYALGQRLLPLCRRLLGVEPPASAAVEIGVFIASRMEQRVSGKKKKNVMLVVPGSTDLSLLIYWQLVNRLGFLLGHIEVGSSQTVIANPLPREIDFVISTVELPNLGEKNIVVPRILTEKDILRLRRQMLGEVHLEDTSSIDGTLKMLAFYDEESRTARELFERIGAQLENDGYAKADYREGLCEHEQTFGSGIETPVPMAIPHTDASLTQIPALAIVVTRRAIPIRLIGSNRSVLTNLFLFPLLEKEGGERGLTFYAVLAKLRNKRIASMLRACKSRGDILSFADQNL